MFLYYTVILVHYVIWYVGYVIYDTFWSRSKKFDFMVKQFLDKECSITLETLDKIKYGFVENVIIMSKLNPPTWTGVTPKDNVKKNKNPFQ